MRSVAGPSRGSAIGAVVLLAGGVVAPPLAHAAGCSVLDLTASADETILQRWVRLIGEGGVGAGVPVRVVHGPQVMAPCVADDLRETVQIVRERDAYRGPAGAVRDAISDVAAGDWALVIEATRFHTGPLTPVIEAAARNDADVFVSCNEDHSPAGVYAIRRSVFDHVASVGYVDLKEQLIARARAAGDRVHVVAHEGVVSFPLRTRRELLRAAAVSAPTRSAVERPGPMVLTGERWASVVSTRASVDPSAVVVESVVMAGARIEADAVVARSVVCPGGIVERGRTALDEIIGAARSATNPGTDTHNGTHRHTSIRARLPMIRFGRRVGDQQGTAT